MSTGVAVVVGIASFLCYGAAAVVTGAISHHAMMQTYRKEYEEYEADQRSRRFPSSEPYKPDGEYACLLGLFWPVGMWWAIGYALIHHIDHRTEQKIATIKEREALLAAATKEHQALLVEARKELDTKEHEARLAQARKELGDA